MRNDCLACLVAHADSLIGDSVNVRFLAPTTSDVLQDFWHPNCHEWLTDDVSGEVNLSFSANQITITNLGLGVYAQSSFNGFDVALLNGSPFTSVLYDIEFPTVCNWFGAEFFPETISS